MTMIKRAQTAKISDDLMEDQPDLNPADLFGKDKFKPGSVYDRGELMRPFDPKNGIKIGYDADDFIHNRFTVMIETREYRKVPRFLMTVYRVEKYRPRHVHVSNRKSYSIRRSAKRLANSIKKARISAKKLNTTLHELRSKEK